MAFQADGFQGRRDAGIHNAGAREVAAQSPDAPGWHFRPGAALAGEQGVQSGAQAVDIPGGADRVDLSFSACSGPM